MSGRIWSMLLHGVFIILFLNTAVVVAADTVLATNAAARTSVMRGEMVPYTITLENTTAATLSDVLVVDNYPAGFRYVTGSATLDGVALAPTVTTSELRWDGLTLDTNTTHKLQLLFRVGAGVSDGDRENHAQVFNGLTSTALSSMATATVRVAPDPVVDCTDIIGKVFDDRNLNGHQDAGEEGLAGVRIVTVRGLIVTTDQYGRFHLTCAMVPNEVRGSNFILKLDDRSLPTGYRLTTENPRVQRLTRGKMSKFNFGATLHHVVRIDVADAVFEPGASAIRPYWRPSIERLIAELKKSPSLLRIAYLVDTEEEALVAERVRALKELISREWAALDCCYRMTIETEVVWRHGEPLQLPVVLQ